MATKAKYTVKIVPKGTVLPPQQEGRHADPPAYDRERDEPVFDAAWTKVAERRRNGEVVMPGTANRKTASADR